MSLSLNPALAVTSQLLDEVGDVLTSQSGASAALVAQVVFAVAVLEARHRRVALEAPGTRHEPSASVWHEEIARSPRQWLSTLRERDN